MEFENCLKERDSETPAPKAAAGLRFAREGSHCREGHPQESEAGGPGAGINDEAQTPRKPQNVCTVNALRFL